MLNTLCFKETDWNVRNVKVIKHEKNLSQHGFDFPMYPLVHKCCFHVTAKMVWSQITLTHATHIYYISNKIFCSFYTLSISVFFLFSALSTHSCLHLLSMIIFKTVLVIHKLIFNGHWKFRWLLTKLRLPLMGSIVKSIPAWFDCMLYGEYGKKQIWQKYITDDK